MQSEFFSFPCIITRLWTFMQIYIFVDTNEIGLQIDIL